MTSLCDVNERRRLLGEVLDASQLGLEALDLVIPAVEAAERLCLSLGSEDGEPIAGLCRLVRWAMEDYHGMLDNVREEAATALNHAV
ncbi:hypothetical protein JW897_10145 [Chromobacterium alkanivorans]|uniref:hypothetical protein n=1 Tax=Chromobacterium TaxID=535 RepID=UPI00065295A2|nr:MULTISPECIES: hypothetical protein [Chromobacterium]KMN83878.1 hypothetical protein VK98_00150 [Chromobacterium sp. LK11]MBN3004092.1 hypothetical protein [Chromobacterium alkanivorans]